MKMNYFKAILFAVLCLCTKTALGQIGIISTYATYSTGWTYYNIAVDNTGKPYTAYSNYVYKVDSGAGHMTVVVGGGSSYGDGGLATAAQLNSATDLAYDVLGNMFISDNGDGVIRKVNTSGIISTVAGNHTAGTGYTGDGGPATAAQLDCSRVCVDISGNIYIADNSDRVIRKVNSAGIITTIAGNGTGGFSGDGGAATSAQLGSISGVAVDLSGNVYIGDQDNLRIRKVNTSGIINTIAGNGSSGSSGVGGPATAANINYPQGLTTDGAGNLYIAEWQNCVLAVVNTAGILNTVAGNYSISYSGDGGPATAAGMNAVSDVAIAPNGDIYISDCHNSCIRKVTGSYLSATHVADSFGVFINELCSGPQLTVVTHSYSSSYIVKCSYGDGTSDTSRVAGGYSGTGFVNLTHAYSNPGSYTIKTVLMNGTTAFDSLSYTYVYKLCNTLSTQYYYDANSNCVFDAGDSHITLPILTEVDSNGTAIDTISSTGGIYYTAYGSPGDVYAFKVINSPGSMHVSCPTSGIIYDTLQTVTYNTNLNSIALQCDTSTGYDLSVNAIVPVTGVHDQWGNIYVTNTHCAPVNATVMLHYSNHYQVDMGGGSLDVSPTPASYTDSSVTWNIGGLDVSTGTVDLYYAIWVNPDSGLVVGYPAHSYYTVSPTSGDVDTSNNSQFIVDTVRGGCDPNEMDVAPSGYISSGTNLKYTINFTNTGNDTTYNVYVMDTLSDNVDLSSFRMVMASANMNIAESKSGGHNILKFDFPNINLLDSMHHPMDCSRGLVFTINSKAGLPDGTTIYNHAGVFFDYNPVVTTNTVEDIIGLPSTGIAPLGSKSVDPQIYPNPANSQLNINIGTAGYHSFTITNMVGQQMLQQTITSAITSANIHSLPAGVYYVTFKGDEGNVVRKFVKE